MEEARAKALEEGRKRLNLQVLRAL